MSSFAERVRSRAPRAQPALETDALTKLKPDTDLASVMNLSQNIAYGNNLDARIDVLANSRFIAIVVHHYIAKMYASTNYKEHPMISPPSLMAYCLMLVNGFHLLSDVVERQPMSPSAENFVALPQNQDLFEILADCYVPNFLVPIIAALLPFSSPQRPGLRFIATMACYHPKYDLPHIMTPGLFLMAHNVLSNSALNAPPAQIASDWYTQTVVTFPEPLGEWKVGQLLGNATDGANNTTVNIYHNWLSQRMSSLFNPVTSRFNAARPVLAEIPYQPVTYTDMNNFNPYEYALGLNRQNRSFVFSFMRSASAYIKSEMSANMTLTQVVDSQTANQIVAHMIFPPTMPTWHHKALTPRDNLKTFAHKTADDFAKLIKYLDEYTFDPQVKVKFPKEEDYSPELYLAEDKAYDPTKDPNKFKLFDENRDVTPDCHIFNPITAVPSANYGPICAGLMIENGPIDGLGLPVPDINRPIGLNNMEYLQGTVVLEDTVSIPYGTEQGYRIINRTIQKSRVQKMATALFDMATVRVPRLTNTIMAAAANTNTGYRYISGICSQKFGFTWFAQTSDKNSPINTDLIHLWSSYRVLRTENHFDFTAHHASETDILVFYSLRGLFGTEVLLGQTRHPAELIQ